VIIYHLYSKAHTKTSEHEITVIEEEKAPAGDEYRIMVTCANPASAIRAGEEYLQAVWS
jgi:hypothetical protein